MTRRTLLVTALLAACGGSPTRPATPVIRIEPAVAAQTWYRSTTVCGQGPYELEVPIEGVKHGEEVELRVQAPRAIALHAVMIVDGDEVATTAGTFGANGRTGGRPANTRCIADARERLALARPGESGDRGTPLTPGMTVVAPPPPSTPGAPLQLEVIQLAPPSSHDVLRFRVPSVMPPSGRVRIRLWSTEPNDLQGVLFGAIRIAWRPNVPEAQYEAYLVEQERMRREAERRAAERWRREEEARARRAAASVTVTVRTEAELRADHERAEREWREAREREARARRDAEERARREQIRVALEADRKAKRAAFCAAHHEDRGCWGAGGHEVHAQFEALARGRDQLCAATPEDARCWDDAEWTTRRAAWSDRARAARAATAEPDGPPPAPRPEEVPPKLSANAEWRPGYWHWLDGTWVWLAGMWRVPESDILAEETTTAPTAPPPSKPEPPPPAPVRATVWVPGFWQWNGSGWVWIAGSYQLPRPRTTWRAPEWRAKGTVHVLVPGAWIQLGGGR